MAFVQGQPMRTAYHNFNPSLFLSDNIRGIVGESLNLEDAYYLGKILGTIALYTNSERAIIGHDSRNSSTVLETELARGLVSSGLKVMSIGTCPTALMWFLDHKMKSDLAVMITGSYHDSHHNGFKIMMHGKPFYGEEFKHIAKIALSGNWQFADGGSYISGNANLAYTKRLLANAVLHSETLQVVWYGMSGIASQLLPKFYPALPGNHTFIAEHHHDDEIMTQQLQAHLKLQNADLAIGIDAQCDRIFFVDDQARRVDPDRLLPILAIYLSENKPKGKKIITDYLTSETIILYLQNKGFVCERMPSSRASFHKKMLEEDIFLGLDMNGHFFFSKDYFYGIDDVFMVALKVLEICSLGHALSTRIDALPYSVISPIEKIDTLTQPPEDYLKQIANFLNRDQIAFQYFHNMILVHKKNQPNNENKSWYIIRADASLKQITIRAEADNLENFQTLRNEMLSYLEEAKILKITAAEK